MVHEQYEWGYYKVKPVKTSWNFVLERTRKQNNLQVY